MFTLADEPSPKNGHAISTIFHGIPRPERPAAEAGRSLAWRKLARLLIQLMVPAAAGMLLARSPRRRRLLLEGGVTAIAFGVLRVELARWFRSEPAFDAAGTHGDLELRRYPMRIEAYARVDDTALDRAIDHGYARLAGYSCGANRTGELIEGMMPILTTVDEGRYTVSLVMPPGRALDELPQPAHPGIELRKIPARQIAALRFHGRFTRDNIAAHEHVLLQQLADAGLSARGSISFVAFDSPMTLPFLRRNELWIEVV